MSRRKRIAHFFLSSTAAVRRHWIASVLVFVFILYTAAGLLIVPLVIKDQVLDRVTAAGCRAKLNKVRFNPLTLAVYLYDLQADDPDGNPLFSFSTLKVNLRFASLWRRAVLLNEVKLENPSLHLRTEEQGRLNISRLFGAEEKTGDAPVRFAVDRFSLSRGNLAFSDQARPVPFEAVLTNVSFNIDRFDTLNPALVEFSLSAETADGEQLRWSGKAGMNPFRLDTRADLRNIRLSKLWQYFAAEAPWSIAEGIGSASGAIDADFGKTPLEFKTNAERLSLSQLKLKTADGDQLLAEIPELLVQNLNTSISEHTSSAESVTLNGGRVRLRRIRNEKGAFYEALGPAAQPETVESRPPDNTSRWRAQAAEIKAAGFSIVHDDQSLPRPALIEASNVNFSVRNLSFGSPGSNPAQFEGAASIQTGGSVKINGESGLDPLKTALHFEIGELALPAFEGYLAPYFQALIVQGRLSANGSLELEHAHIKFTGEAALRDVLLRRPEPLQDLAGWKELVFSDALYESPFNLSLKDAALIEPHLYVERTADGKIDLLSLFSKRSEVEPASGTGPEAEDPIQRVNPVFKIDTVKIDGGAVKITDRTVSPPVELEFKDLKAEAAALSNSEERAVPAKITARVVPNAALSVSADLNLKRKAYFDRLHLELQKLYFPLLSSYVGRYAGRRVQEGELTLKMDYREKGGDLSGENSILVGSLRFGEAVKSPDAVSLPLDLAAALLKDQSGTIHLDFPVRGDLSQPDFRIGSLILRALTNAITGVVSSPFGLLASLAGTGRSLDRCFFSYGSTELSSEEQLRLEDLAKALRERPALTLAIAPLYDPENDKRVLAKEILKREVLGESSESAEDKDYAKALLNYYREKFKEKPEIGKIDSSAPPDEIGRFEKVEPGERAVLIAQVQEALLKQISVPEQELKQLALRRGKNIHNRLERELSLGERVTVLEPSEQKFHQAKLFVPLTVKGEP